MKTASALLRHRFLWAVVIATRGKWVILGVPYCRRFASRSDSLSLPPPFGTAHRWCWCRYCPRCAAERFCVAVGFLELVRGCRYCPPRRTVLFCCEISAMESILWMLPPKSNCYLQCNRQCRFNGVCFALSEELWLFTPWIVQCRSKGVGIALPKDGE